MSEAEVSARAETGLSIRAVEHETGLSKDVLRKWEQRYGFPSPLRDGAGERLYPADQVARLRLIKRLMDSGMRPSRVVAQPLDALTALAAGPAGRDLCVRHGAGPLLR